MSPLANLFLKEKNTEPKDQGVYDLGEINLKTFSIEIFIASLLLGVPGMFLMLIINLPLGLALESFVLSLIFGMTFGILLLFYLKSRKSEESLWSMLKQPFKESRNRFLKLIILGIILAVILYILLYFSLGLNYIAIVPSITKIFWIPFYMVVAFIVFLPINLAFQNIFQTRFKESRLKSIKVALLHFSMMFLYQLIYLLIFSIILRNWFYFGIMIPISIPMFLLYTFSSSILYSKTRSVIPASIINMTYFTMIVSTLVTSQFTFSFITSFF
jgi:hypothetical protein